MKKAFAPLVILLSLTACKDNTSDILSTIDGRWQVNAITVTNRTGGDSVATATNAFLVFDACSKSSNNNGPGNCSVTYQEGRQAYPFTYQAGDKSKVVSLTPTSQPNNAGYQQKAGLLAGGYDIVAMTDHSLMLHKQLYDKNIVATVIQISATK